MCGACKSIYLATQELLHYLDLGLCSLVVGRGRLLDLLLLVCIPGEYCTALIRGGIPLHGGQSSLGLCNNVGWHDL